MRNHGSPDKIPFLNDADPTDFLKLVEFARNALEDIRKVRGPHCFYGPIIRVDVMQMQSGQLVVNEIESLEAQIDAQGHGASIVDSRVHQYLIEYWYKRIDNDLRIAEIRRGII